MFRSSIGTYNDNSGAIRFDIGMGPVLPPPSKGRIPAYNKTQLQQLQTEMDALEALNVLATPESAGVMVKHISPSFLIKKPSGEFRLVTNFTGLSQYTRPLPSVSSSCEDVLRKLASWKYIVKTDLTKAFYQIPASKDSIPFLGTITPFKGLRVYLTSVMGAPGASECLIEVMCRVFGDFMCTGFVIVKDDDL